MVSKKAKLDLEHEIKVIEAEAAAAENWSREIE